MCPEPCPRVSDSHVSVIATCQLIHSPGDMNLWIARVNIEENQADQLDIEHFILRTIQFNPQKPFFRNMNIHHL